jgi:hypothetical protein
MDDYKLTGDGHARIILDARWLEHLPCGNTALIVDEMVALLLADALQKAAAKIIDPRGEETAKRRSEGAKVGWEVRRTKEGNG